MPKKNNLKSIEPREPTAAEIAQLEAERIEERRATFHKAAKLAKEVFGRDPTPEMVIGASDILSGGVPENLVVTIAQKARDLAAKYNGGSPADVETVFAVFDVLLEDEQGEEHLADAAKEAASVCHAGSVTAGAVLDVYFAIYGSEEDPEPEFLE